MSRAEDIFEKLVYSGEDALDEFIRERQTEELFLDFKQAASTGKHGQAFRLVKGEHQQHQNRRKKNGKYDAAVNFRGCFHSSSPP